MDRVDRFKGGRRFHYDSCWAERPECAEMVQNIWFKTDGRNNMQRVVNRLSVCARHLKRWNGDNMRNLQKNILCKKKELACITGVGNSVDWDYSRRVERELDNLLKVDEVYWKQLSGVSWLNEGDLYTKFFHAKASSRRTRNNLRGLFDSNGIWKAQDGYMVSIINEYFSSLFASSKPSHSQLDSVFNVVEGRLPTNLKIFLDELFTAKEVRCAFFQMSPSKAPGIDDFPVGFFQKFWGVIGDDMTKVCLDCLNDGHSMDKLNHSLLCLIPKIRNVERISNIRPISLCHVVYKCISKALANRLCQVLGRVIDDTQSAFISGRGFIKPTPGLRQEDPLSPYLFILCAEGFSSLISKSERCGAYNGFRCSRLGPKITHLFFMDDSLLFTRASMEECVNIKGLIKIYTEASSQIINFQKSAVCFSKQISTSDKNLLAGFLEMKIVDHHNKYLGLSCVTSRSKRALFNSVKERVWKKLQSWSSRFFSSGGQEILLKAVIQSIPIYTMNLFRLPVTLIYEIHRMCARFWWNGEVLKHKLQWCSWDLLCKAKENGGFGFRDLNAFNKAMLRKQCWRLFSNMNLLVARVLKGCYFPEIGQEKFWDGVSFLDFVLSCKEKMESMELELLCVVWWRIWHTRNQMFHSSVLLPDCEIYDWAVGFLAEFQMLNFEGNFSSVGVVIRDSNGFVKRSLYRRFEVCFLPQIIEAMAILRGLHLALENGLVPMILESDALDLVNKIRSQTVPSYKVGDEFVWLEDCPLVAESLVLGDYPNSL
ncbi:hypothetical protein Ddye_004550 [Dipteronia dyeriana]|uniref:RNase H type-1 domain-containing protein n=1 Tax=Dipteronia dyeriana TaxID=168575 RepID=A0AAD9XV43_9ROSI|nr:hypothetical protein Ddye_004550 [Dipteronia dyeriana]